ncbi:MAG: DUF1653 domain-containing protein [Clostridia bacterium]|nr:DUF1653 domain-containing protein [Clostridia bacterium]
MENGIKMGIYRHFKGGVYEAVAIALHSETMEEMVVYRNVESGKYWVRPASMWNETVEYNGQTVKRFTYVEEQL